MCKRDETPQMLFMYEWNVKICSINKNVFYLQLTFDNS